MEQVTATPTPAQQQKEAPKFMEAGAFTALCETEAANFIDKRYCSPGWAKNIRSEYATMVYNACNENLNADEGIFSEDGADMDLAAKVARFHQRHPGVDYCCNAQWRSSILKKLKENFKAAANAVRERLHPTVREEDIVPGDEMMNDNPEEPQVVKKAVPQSQFNPNQSVVQTLHDVSNRIWSAWRVMSDLASSQLVSRVNMGDLDEKEFNSVLKLRDNLRKCASEVDDLGLQFRIIKKDDEEETND